MLLSQLKRDWIKCRPVICPRIMKNAYNTTDPQKLLDLKRLESDALLDVLRTINHAELKISQLCTITRNVLRAQLGVKKMIFFYFSSGEWIEGLRVGFSRFNMSVLDEMIGIRKLTSIDSSSYPRLSSHKVEYVIPIDNKGEITAYFVIAEFADTEMEAQSDLIFIETLGNILSVAIQNKQLFQENMRRELLIRELEVAETIQKQLLISDFSRFKDVDISAKLKSHYRIGGDFYDVINKGEKTIFVCIADVSGKGIGAALLMSNLQANLRALCAQYESLESIIQELNSILFNITTGEKFVTLFLARIDIADQKVTYVNAGHNYPIFLHNNAYKQLESGSVLLGIMPNLEVEVNSFRYHPGDLLFMYTDGIVEQENEKGEMFGTERLINILKGKHAYSSNEITQHVLHMLYNYSRDVEASDDITMLSVKFLA